MEHPKHSPLPQRPSSVPPARQPHTRGNSTFTQLPSAPGTCPSDTSLQDRSWECCLATKEQPEQLTISVPLQFDYK